MAPVPESLFVYVLTEAGVSKAVTIAKDLGDAISKFKLGFNVDACRSVLGLGKADGDLLHSLENL
jgi:hypothetical protein